MVIRPQVPEIQPIYDPDQTPNELGKRMINIEHLLGRLVPAVRMINIEHLLGHLVPAVRMINIEHLLGRLVPVVRMINIEHLLGRLVPSVQQIQDDFLELKTGQNQQINTLTQKVSTLEEDLKCVKTENVQLKQDLPP